MTISNQIISFKLSGINYSGTSTALNYTAGVTAGTCIASKALVVDVNKAITGIGNITSTSSITANTFTGTLQTAAQPNITTIGTLSNLTVSDNLTINGHNGTTSGLVLSSILVTSSASQLNYNNITTIGAGQASKTMVLDAGRNINNINTLTSTNLVTNNLTIGGTQLNISGAQINYNNISTPGIAEASKSLILNSSSNVTGINSLSSITLTATNLNGTLQTASQPNITTIGTLSSLSLSGAITGLTDLEISGNLTGAANIYATNLYGLLLTSDQHNITSVGTLNNLSVNGTLTTSVLNVGTLSINSVAITATSAQINVLAGVTPGAALASKVLVIDASRNITNINSLTATSIISTNVTGSLQTPAQPNVTSLGTLTSLLLSGVITGVTNLTMSGTLSGASVLSATTLTGLLSTIAQTNITSLGTLSSLKVTANLALGTTTPDRQMEINSSTGNCLRLSHNAPTGSAINYADLLINSSGDLTLLSSSNRINLSSRVVIGNSSSTNEIRFNGVTGDTGINNTVISERLYGASDFSELLLFKGNDISGASGPDRIRLRTGEIRFQIFSTNEDYTTLADNNNAMVIASNGRVGINTTSPQSQLEINSSTGTCLRLTFNDNDGGAVNYTDFSINSGGRLFLLSNSNGMVIGGSADIAQELIIGAYSSTATVGIFRFLNFGGANYIQSGVSLNAGSSADLVISDWSQAINTSTRKIIFKGGGKVGFGTSTPSKQLDINATDGGCLRLSFNAPAGSATTYCDYSLTSVGQMSFNTVGTSPSFNFTGGNVSATIATASQPNITSLGILTSLTLAGELSGVTNLSMSGNLTGATSISATSLIGTLTTVAQPNITSVGILPSLLVSSNAKFGVASSAPQDIVHIEGSINDFIGLQIENRNTTAGSSGGKLSFTGFSSTNDNYEIARIASITTTSGVPASYQFGSLAFYTRGTDLSTNADERMRITNVGNVGIGFTTPSYTLDVNGISRSLQLLAGTSTDITSTRLISALDSNIGTGIRYITLGKVNSANNQLEIGYTHISDGSASNIASFGFSGATSATRFHILANGLCGFGTNLPNRQVEINQSAGNCLRLSNNAPTGSASIFADLTVGSGGNLNINPTGTYITTTKRFQTTVSGYGFAHAVSGGAELVTYVDTIDGRIGTYSNHPFNLISNNIPRLVIATTGYVGIGTTTPTVPLHVPSSASISVAANYAFSNSAALSNNSSGGTTSVSASFGSSVVSPTFFATSDKRLKCNFKELDHEYCKNFILKTTPMQYSFKNNTDKINYGYIAQDIYRIGYENLVSLLQKDDMEEIIDDDNFVNPKDFMFTIDYNSIIPILAKNIKNIYEENEILKNENTELKKALASILERLDNLESK